MGEVPRTGVALSYLLVFLDENGGRSKMHDMSTADVKQYVVKIQTAAAQETYVQRLTRQSVTSPEKARFIGQATHYVIHSWKGKFVDMVDSLNHHFEQQQDGEINPDKVFVWIDLFSFNQHVRDEKGPPWFKNALETGLIRSIGQTLCVMHPFDTCSIFQRAWCLYEIFAVARQKVKFEVVMPPDEYERFLASLTLDPQLFLSIPTSQVKSKYAQATKVEDKNAIFALVEQELSEAGAIPSGSSFFIEWDAIVTRAFENWLVHHLQRIVIVFSTAQTRALEDDCTDENSVGASKETTEAVERSTGWMRTLATVYEALGRLESSLPLRQQVVQSLQGLYGDQDDRYLGANGALAELYKLMGRFEKARPLLEISLGALKASAGDDDPRTLQATQELAVLCECQGLYDQAEALFLECFSQRRRCLGDDHRDTLTTMHSLAILLSSVGRSSEAITMFNDCITKRKRICGEDSKDTFDSIMGLALLLNELGKYDQALALLRRVLGDNSMETLRCMGKLAASHSAQGKFADATGLLEEVVEKFGKALGKQARETIDAMFALATNYDDLRQFDRALPLFQECLRAHRELEVSALVASDPREAEVTRCLEAIAQLQLNVGNTAAALEAFHECLDRESQNQLGSRTTERANSARCTSLKNRIALLYFEIGEVDRAMDLVKECLHERNERLGPDHTDTLSSLSFLASLFQNKGDLHQALRLFEDCLKRRSAILGKESAHTKTLKRKVLDLRKTLGPAEEEAKVDWASAMLY